MSFPLRCDVLVAGSGNAGFSAAIAAKEAGADHVVLIDKCPEEWAGGNSYFTAGAYRTAHNGLLDLLPLVNNVDEELTNHIDLGPYTISDFEGDMQRMCEGRSDPSLSSALIHDSNSAVKWLAKNGIRFQLSFNRQAYKVNGRFKFWGGMALKTQDGGKGLIEDLRTAARRLGVVEQYSTPLTKLNIDLNTGAVISAVVQHLGKTMTIKTGAVILATGGFESNAGMRSHFLGPEWVIAKVRGTPYNTGEGLEIAIRDAFAAQAGDWSGCHSTCWDADAANDTGDRATSNEYTKSGYPLGLMINNRGVRFVDEGSDMRNFTYAKFGRAILYQPGSTAFQVWDSQMIPHLRDEEYRPERVRRVMADSITELADHLVPLGLEDRDSFVSTVKEYNQAVYSHMKEYPDRTWNPAIKDRSSTQSKSTQLSIAKSNWATPLEEGPFMAVQVTCGITFTFGGLAIDPATSQVISSDTKKGVPGLYCVGETVGGLFYNNYPGGSGLTSGTVFGRRAGTAAAKTSQKSEEQAGPRL